LADLNASRLFGFLHGFIDRLAVSPDAARWGVIDWKTNKLGDNPASYDTGSLRRCAIDSHYFLQVHLYLVALRRHLGKSAAAGDAWLVFLRGVAAGNERGILHIRPPDGLLADLDALFFKP
jgi:exodeoxyribonuclease V beta subunit